MFTKNESAFIGVVHRFGAQLKVSIKLVCSAFNSDPKRVVETDRVLCLPEPSQYSNVNQMLIEVLELPRSERMAFVVIATPKKLDFEVEKSTRVCGTPILAAGLVRG